MDMEISIAIYFSSASRYGPNSYLWCHWVVTTTKPFTLVFLGTRDTNEIKNSGRKQSYVLLPNLNQRALGTSSFMLWLKFVLIYWTRVKYRYSWIQFMWTFKTYRINFILFLAVVWWENLSTRLDGNWKKFCVGWRWDEQRLLGRQRPFCWCVCLWGGGWAGWA